MKHLDTKFRNFSKEEIHSASNFEIIPRILLSNPIFLSFEFHRQFKDSMNRPNNIKSTRKIVIAREKTHSPPFLSLSSAVSRKWSNGSTRKIRDHSPHHLSPLCTTFHLLLTAVHLLIRHRRSTQFPPPLESSTE